MMRVTTTRRRIARNPEKREPAATTTQHTRQENCTMLSFFSLGSNSSEKQTRQQLLKVLQDDSVQALSSLELNQWATLTFQDQHASASTDDLCECLFSTLSSVMSQPLVYSPIAIHKALAIAKHVLLLGADKVLNEGRVLIRPVTSLLSYNTALLAQQQKGATGFLVRLKGGTQDQGGPVRDLAAELQGLLTNISYWQQQRAQSADPQSLVPVGDRAALGFCTDTMRLQILQREIQKQSQLKSNLNAQVQQDGFGGGYVSRDGKNVVGAAHSLEEMMEHAKRQEQKFIDSNETQQQQQQQQQQQRQSNGTFSEYVAPSMNALAPAFAVPPQDCVVGAIANAPSSGETPDLLSLDNSTTQLQQQQQRIEQADLLDLGSSAVEAVGSTSTTSQHHSDLMSLTTSMPTYQMPQSQAPAPLKEARTAIMTTPSSTDPFGVLSSQFGTTMNSNLGATTASLAGFSSTLMGSMPISQAATTNNAFGDLNPLARPQQQQPPTLSAISCQPQEDSFVMGGATGSGLNPMGHAPAAPPPPPPSWI